VRRSRRRGVALLLVLWIMAVLTLLMYAFLGEMQVEYSLSAGHADGLKASQLAWSAIDRASMRVLNQPLTHHSLSDPWSDDENAFFEVPYGDGAYTVFRPVYGDVQRVQWGLDDEASKINLNLAPREVLLKLPRMTEEIVDAIIDWRDEDDVPGPAGAEESYYASLPVPYHCKNAPFESLEELLYVKGMTPEILFGEDVNLNGILDPNENDGDESWPPDNRDGRLDPGLWPLLTVWSSDLNVTSTGSPRANLNLATPQQLQEAGFEAGEIQAINASRVVAGPFTSIAQLLGDPRGGRPPILSRERFKLVCDAVTVIDAEVVPGLVNLNTAPKQVLLALPGISEEIALKIISQRTPQGADLSNMGWVADLVEPAELLAFANFVTFRAYQFRVHAVGRIGTPYEALDRGGEAGAERPRPFRRMVAVFDTLAEPAPRLVYWKDQTRLGMPFDPADGPAQER
jgi:type II secretory pathway component PulK